MPTGGKWASWADGLLLVLGLLQGAAALPDRTCPQCQPVEDRRLAAQLKVEAIKRQILSKLSLQSKPNITSPPPRDAVLEALAKSTEGPYLLDQPRSADQPETPADDDYYARTSEIIAFAEPGSSLNGHVLLDFNQQHESPQRLKVTGGTLWVQLRYVTHRHRRVQQMLRNHTVTLYVFRVTNTSNLHMDMVAKQRLQASSVGWQQLDVHQAVQRWFSGPSGKFTLLVDCSGCDSLVELALFDERKTDSRRLRHRGRPQADVRPFLTIATETLRRRRVRRHTITCGPHTTQCCKQSLYVSFSDLGWDNWIIAPKGYYANYCMGECVQRTPDTFAHFHTHIIEEYRQKNPYASITPCCAPTRLSSMSLIYLDPKNNIIKTDLPKMIVDECGCT